MKTVALFIILFWISFETYSQTDKDTTGYIYFKDESGNQKKAIVATPPQVLIVAEDSIYTVLDEIQLRSILEKQEGFDIINDPDSIALFLRKRIKAIAILKMKKDK